MKVLILISLMFLISCEKGSDEAAIALKQNQVDETDPVLEVARVVEGTYNSECLEGSNRYYTHEVIIDEFQAHVVIAFFYDDSCQNQRPLESGYAAFNRVGEGLEYSHTQLTYANIPENTPQCTGIDHANVWGEPKRVDDIDCEYSLENVDTETYTLRVNENDNYVLNGVEYI